MEEDIKNEEQKRAEELKNLDGQTCKIYYFNNVIEDFPLPLFLNELRTQVKHLFRIESRANDEIFVIYTFLNKSKDKEVIEEVLEAKTDDDYFELLKRVKSDEIKDDTIYIETDKVPAEISRTRPKTFEDEIKCVIERELKSAADKIKKYLSGNKKCYPSAKTHKQFCSKCCRPINGDIYKSVIDIEEKLYCEKCSFNQKDPCFIIH